MKFISKADVFGSSFNFPVNGKTVYRTALGGCLTALSFVLMCVVTFLFGQDFFYKKNPTTLTNFGLSKDGEVPYVPITTSNFTVMYKFSDPTKPLITKEETIFYPAISFEIFSTKKSKEMTIEKRTFPEPVNCATTKAVDNPYLTGYDLSYWMCIDWEQVTKDVGEQAFLGGQWENDRLAFLKLNFQTCPFNFKTGKNENENCSSFSQVQDRLNKQQQMINYVIPDYTYDSTNYEEPIKVAYKYNWLKATSSIYISRQNDFTKVTLKDDIGWIFEDIKEYEAVHKEQVIDQFNYFGPNDFTINKNQRFLTMTFYFLQEELIHSRSFVKIQQLVANVGGILKFILVVFQFLNGKISETERDFELVDRLFEVQDKKIFRLATKISKKRLPEVSNANSSVDAVAQIQNLKVANHFEGNILCAYFKKWLCCSKNEQLVQIKSAINAFYKTVDVTQLYRTVIESQVEDVQKEIPNNPVSRMIIKKN